MHYHTLEEQLAYRDRLAREQAELQILPKPRKPLKAEIDAPLIKPQIPRTDILKQATRVLIVHRPKVANTAITQFAPEKRPAGGRRHFLAMPLERTELAPDDAKASDPYRRPGRKIKAPLGKDLIALQNALLHKRDTEGKHDPA